ncbi:helix-turn-helix domain-containing protein [Lactococcus allomyrinae]|uniref:XRE family transcriptional regulator n=1 Tax=Lactococcus allomyrinae TaxID=2419773 RepID=A0A387BHU7_9LACT|nr:helix-turn-helix transcriptional regulator [Lactococcus allomyrinae]AYG00587.1 XRE family transcriptional regulator [Lactococcus allomyrinae]
MDDLEDIDINKKMKIFRTEMRRYRIPILKLSEDIGYPAAFVSDVLFLRKKPDIKILEKLERVLNSSAQDKGVNLCTISGERCLIDTKDESHQNLNGRQSEFLDNLGEKIRGIRTRLNLSEVEFGRELSPRVSSRLVWEIEENKFTPSLEHLIQIADLGEVTLDWLLRIR